MLVSRAVSMVVSELRPSECSIGASTSWILPGVGKRCSSNHFMKGLPKPADVPLLTVFSNSWMAFDVFKYGACLVLVYVVLVYTFHCTRATAVLNLGSRLSLWNPLLRSFDHDAQHLMGSCRHLSMSHCL